MRADGLILTNNHVIADAEKLSVRLKDGRSFPAKVLGTDDKTDIAVLQIDAKNLPVVEFGDSDTLRIGQLVCAIGAPFNQDYSFSAGWVSGKGRTDLLGPTSRSIIYEDYIQTDAFINPGNSGGPLFDVEGKVVGMNTLINGIGRGLAFAIPSSMLQEISGILIAQGRVQRPYLGIRIETLGKDPSLREHVAGVSKGVVVDTIEIDAPAYRSDLRAADVITAVDGAAVTSSRELQKEILKKKIGQTLRLTVWRNGTMIEIPVATGELPSEITKVVNPATPPVKALGNGEPLGLKLKDSEAIRGAVVVEIVPDSPASKVEIQAGDLITAVDTKPVGNAAAAVKAMTANVTQRDQRGVLLNLERAGKRTFVVLKANP
jgi:S1-C subfamily serine protease